MKKNKKKSGYGLLGGMLCTVLLAGFPTEKAYADNALIEEQMISDGIGFTMETPIETENITLENFLWPNKNGQYSYTYAFAELGKKYMLLTIPGVHKSLQDMETDGIVTDLTYIDQKTAQENGVSFDNFIPANEGNCTVIITGEDMQPSIVGYISKDYFQFGFYTREEDKTKAIDNSYVIAKNTTWEEFKNTLPQKGYMEIYSDYVDTIYMPVDFQWQENNNFITNRVGKTMRVVADITVGEVTEGKGLEELAKPFVITVTVGDPIGMPQNLTAIKQKQVYQVGEEIKDQDIDVKAVYSDQTVRSVNGWTSNVTSLSTNQEGIQYIVITYVEEGMTYETQVPIRVVKETQEENPVCKVQFETFGGSYISDCVIGKGEKIQPEEEPVKSGFIFEGWYTDRYTRHPFDPDSEINSDLTLYAGWRNLEERVLADLMVTLENENFVSGTALTEDMISVWAVYDNGEKEEVTSFLHNLESIDQTLLGTKQLQIEYTKGNITKTCEVKFRIVKADNQSLYTVAFQTQCEQTIASKTVVEGEGLTEPVWSGKKEGYVFAGWYIQDKKWNFEKDKVTEDITLTAKWLKKYGMDSEIYSYIEENKSFEYTGKAMKPEVVVIDKNLNVLVKNKDYTLKYENNTSVSTQDSAAKIIVKGKGNYSGQLEIPFTITQKDIADESKVSMKLAENNIYKRGGYRPVPTIKYNGKSLKFGQDFEVEYLRLENYDSETGRILDQTVLEESGYYLITIHGKGNYTGTKNLLFRIVDSQLKNLSKASVKIDKEVAKVPYTGSEVNIGFGVKVSLGNITLTEGEDYELIYPENNVDIGKKTVVIKALPNSNFCFGEKAFTYNITGLEMKSSAVSFYSNKVDYTGQLLGNNVKSVTLKLDKNKAQVLNAYYGTNLKKGDVYTLKEDTDYTTVYKNNENAGKATVIFTGKGIFSGSIKKIFNINKVKFNSEQIAVVLKKDTVKQKKSGATVDVTVVHTLGEHKINLKKGIDYTVTYAKNKAVGSNGTVTVKGIGNYTGSISKKFSILPKALNSSEIKVTVVEPVQINNKKDNYVYKPSIMVTDGEESLKNNRDYVIDYRGCVTQKEIKEGKTNGYVILKEKGSYSGFRVVPYQVLINSIAGKNCTIDISDMEYTGNLIEFNFDSEEDCKKIKAEIVLDQDQVIKLIPGVDFVITGYSKNINQGTAKVTLKGIGDYTGTKTVSFKIVKQNL